MSKYAIVTNDLQFAAANKHKKRQDAVSTFLPIQIKLLKDLRKLNIPIIHLQLIVSDDDPRSKGIPDEQKFTKGSKGAAILKEVFEEGDIIIDKPKDSGFFETTLDETLKKLGVKTLIISGMQTQICVQTTAADAHFRGYKVLIPSDAVTSSRPGDTKRSLDWLANYCAKVLPSDDLVKLIKKDLKE